MVPQESTWLGVALVPVVLLLSRSWCCLAFPVPAHTSQGASRKCILPWRHTAVVSRCRPVLYIIPPAKQGGVALGVQTAQLLLNDTKRRQFKEEMALKFPLVPESMFDSAMSVVATAFKTIAPETLKQALQPGGMDKVRPVLKEAIVDLVVKQEGVKNFRVLSDSDKSKLMGAIVDLTLDQVLQDAQWLLAAPEVRLDALKDEIRLIQRTEISAKQVALYRFWRPLSAPGRSRRCRSQRRRSRSVLLRSFSLVDASLRTP